MREILFKAKQLDDGKWVEGYLIKISEDDYRIATVDDIGHAYTKNCDYDGYMTEIDPNTICQYTGLTDKKGNKIWEKDICYDEIDKCVICYGIYDNNTCCEEHMGFYTNWEKLKNKYRQDIGYWTSEIEVIGTIFDNPELLENE